MTATASGIYEIVAPSGRRYIGSAVIFERRFARHRKDLRLRTHGNRNLQRAADKYGLENLCFRPLLLCRPEDLLFYEQRAIDGLRPEYNLARIAGSALGIVRTDEFRAKIRAALRGRVVSAETREKIGAKHRGKKLTPEQIRKWRAGLKPMPTARRRRIAAAGMLSPEGKAKKAAAMIGHKVSPETREKIRAALKGRRHSPERIAAIKAGKRRCVVACTLQTD